MEKKFPPEMLKKGVGAWNIWRQLNQPICPALEWTDLSGLNLAQADFREAFLSNSDLSRSNLFGANISKAWLKNVSFTDAIFGETIIGDVDLSEVSGLEKTFHDSPSYISTSTLQRSRGKIPEEFLRGCGLSDWEIESAKLYNPDLNKQDIDVILYRMHDLRAHQPLQISPLFISYSHIDGKFIDKVEEQLKEKGIRFWRDIHHATAGRLEKQIDMAIRLNPTVLVILSENSTKSDWVLHEIRTARNLEKELGRDVLCPVALDDSWKTSPWPKHVMEQVKEYNILDFSKWEDDNEFKKQFKKLIDGLNIFYK